jgi:hypothetical protein
MQKEQLQYRDFLKVVLDFQLQEHLDFLGEFARFFKQVDTKGYGLLNESEFRLLISKMCRRSMEEQGHLPNDESSIDRVHSLQLL